jgi:NAD(P)H-dependent FMN reductase
MWISLYEGEVRMMILGIVGSPRKSGRTNLLVEAALKGAHDQGAPTTKIYLVDYTLKAYTGQGGSREAYTFCPEALSQLCETADALIIGAPVYWGDINGLTKDFMDTVRINNASGKPALGIAVAGGSGKGLLSGVQSIYHFFYHKQMRAIDPTPISRFNLEAMIPHLIESGAKLVDLATAATPFVGETWDARWPEVLAYYTTLPYLKADPLDEFLMLADQLLQISTNDAIADARRLYIRAVNLSSEGDREGAARAAVQSYQLLFFPPTS